MAKLPLLVIDPGKNALGWAYFGDAGFCVAAGVVRAGEDEETAYAARACMMALHKAIMHLPTAKRLVTEQMVVYPGPQSKSDPNDLITLTFIAGGGHFLCAPDAELVLIKPAMWKGQVSKEIVKQRMEKRLTPLESKLLEASLQSVVPSLRHNGIDAVSIGLVDLGRMGR